MDIYGMYDRLLEHSGKALRWLDKHAYLEAQRELEKVVTQDGSYVPRDLKAQAVAEPPPEEPATISALSKPLPPTEKSDLQAGTITVSYPGGRHTFHRTGPDQWTLALEAVGLDDCPSVTGYDNGNVLRVLASFLVGSQ